MEENVIFTVNYDTEKQRNKTKDYTYDDIHRVISAVDSNHSINWIDDENGFRHVDRLTPSLQTARNTLKGDR
jgi:hypothetical protein